MSVRHHSCTPPHQFHSSNQLNTTGKYMSTFQFAYKKLATKSAFSSATLRTKNNKNDTQPLSCHKNFILIYIVRALMLSAALLASGLTLAATQAPKISYLGYNSATEFKLGVYN